MTDANMFPIHADCDESIRKAVLQLELAIINSDVHYSTESRRYSIWSLVAKHLDQPVATFLTSWADSLSFLPSLPRLFAPYAFSGLLRKSIRDTEIRIEDAIRSVRNRSDDDYSDWSSHGIQDNTVFYATMETLFSVTWICGSRRPKQGLRNSFGRATEARRGDLIRTGTRKGTRRPDTLFLLNDPYCELCWRLCEHAEHPELVPRQDHDRYCSDHSKKSNDAESSTRYRTDHNHREQFHRELYFCFRSSPESQLIRLGVKVTTDLDRQLMRLGTRVADYVQGVRYLAYSIVRAKLSSRHEAILLMHWAGKPQAVIAVELGLSRQAVSAALKNMPRIVEQIRALAINGDQMPRKRDALDDYIAYSKNPTKAGAKRLLQMYGNLVPLEAISLI